MENLTGQGNQDKLVQMPTSEVMFEKLENAGLFGISPQTDKFYRSWVEQLADAPKYGKALQTAWELAAYYTLSGLPPTVQTLVDMNFNRAVDAVAPDPEVAAEAKKFRDEVHASLEEETH